MAEAYESLLAMAQQQAGLTGMSSFLEGLNRSMRRSREGRADRARADAARAAGDKAAMGMAEQSLGTPIGEEAARDRRTAYNEQVGRDAELSRQLESAVAEQGRRAAAAADQRRLADIAEMEQAKAMAQSRAMAPALQQVATSAPFIQARRELEALERQPPDPEEVKRQRLASVAARLGGTGLGPEEVAQFARERGLSSLELATALGAAGAPGYGAPPPLNREGAPYRPAPPPLEGTSYVRPMGLMYEEDRGLSSVEPLSESDILEAERTEARQERGPSDISRAVEELRRRQLNLDARPRNISEPDWRALKKQREEHSRNLAREEGRKTYLGEGGLIRSTARGLPAASNQRGAAIPVGNVEDIGDDTRLFRRDELKGSREELIAAGAQAVTNPLGQEEYWLPAGTEFALTKEDAAKPTQLQEAVAQLPGAPQPPAAPEVAPQAAPYSVQKGDTLFELAKANDTTVDAIIQANPGIKDPNLIEVGQSITMPKGGAPRVDEVATVAEGAPAPAPPKGSAAEAVSKSAGVSDLSAMSDIELKARIRALGEEKGGIRANPLAEASGGTMDPSVIPRIAEVEKAIIDAKGGDRRHLSRILGKSISWQDLKKMDLNKLSADYRSWAGGLNLRADEIKVDRELEEELKQTRAYEGKAAMFELSFRGIFPVATPEQVETFQDQALNIYKAGKGDEAVMAYLDLFRGLGKDEMAHELRMSQEATKRAKLNASNAAGSKSKGLKDYFNYLEQANKNERLAQEAQKNIDSQTLTQQEKGAWVSKKAAYDKLAAQFRSDAEKVRAANQGIDYGTRLAMQSNLLRRLEQNRAALDRGGDSAWAQYISGIKSDIAVAYGVYPGMNEDMESIEIALRRAYLSKPKGTARAEQPKKDAEPYSSFQEKLTPEAAEIAGPKAVAKHEARRSAMAPGIESKKDGLLKKLPELRARAVRAVNSGDDDALRKVMGEVRRTGVKLAELERQFKDVADFGTQDPWRDKADQLYNELKKTTGAKRIESRESAADVMGGAYGH